MSSRSKGSQYEREVERIYLSEGYWVERATPKIVYIRGRPITTSHDFFHCFDLICKKPGTPTHWVQVTVWENVAHRKKTIETFPHTPGHDECLIFARIRGRNPHYRVLSVTNGFDWQGDVKMVIKK